MLFLEGNLPKNLSVFATFRKFFIRFFKWGLEDNDCKIRELATKVASAAVALHGQEHLQSILDQLDAKKVKKILEGVNGSTCGKSTTDKAATKANPKPLKNDKIVKID